MPSPAGWSPADLLPGIYFLLLAALLGAALRRWYDPVPRRVLAVLALLPLLLFGRALVGGEVLLPLDHLRKLVPFQDLPPAERLSNDLQGDLVHQIAPWQLEVRRALSDGRWPLWNAGAGAGMPLMGDPQAQAFQPLVLAAYPFPIWEAQGVTAALRVLAASLFLFLLLRRQGLPEPAALLGGAAFGLGGFLLLWLGWPMANSAALLPLALYAVLRVDEEGGARDLFLLFLAVLGLLLGGHPETVLYALTMVGVFLLARASGRGGGARRRFALLARAGLAIALAGLAAAPVLLPVREYLPATQRASVADFHLAPRPLGELWRDLRQPEALAAWRERVEERLVPVAAARAFGDFRAYWGSMNLIEDAGGFAGSATLFLALLAMIPGRSGTVRRFPQERLAAGVLLVCLLLIAQPPGFERVFARLPAVGVTAIHQHHRTLMLVALCLSWLAACEAGRWLRGEGRRGVVTVTGVALAVAGLVAWGYLGHPPAASFGRLAGQRVAWMAVQLAALALGAGLLLLRRRRRMAGWLLAGVVAVELLVLHGPLNPPAPRRLAYPVTPPLRFLQEGLGDGRMVGLGRGVLPANFPLVYGLNDVRIDNPSLPERYAGVLSLVQRDLWSMVLNLHRPASPVYDLLGVRYVLTRPGVELALPLRPVFRHPSGWVYERPGALPRLFLPVRGHVFQGGSWREWLDGNPDFAARALFQSTPQRDRNWRARWPRASRLEIVSLEAARIQARAELVERRLLASGVFQDGNWHLLVDGEPRPAILANGPFVAGWLRAGEEEIDLIYRPRSFVLGSLLAALALAGAAAWWLPRPASVRDFDSNRP